MKYKLSDICYGRSGDKGRNSNIGLIFIHTKLYDWAVLNLDTNNVKNYLNKIVKGEIVRYKLNNIYALNFILHDSLGGGGSDSLLNDAQGKTHAQTLLMMEIDLPDSLRRYVNE